MYQYYDITLQGSDTVKLTYQLEQHRPAQVWAGLIHNAKVENLRPNLNPWQNFDKNILHERIIQLESLIDKLNEWLPEKIKGKWNHSNHQESVNRLHVHFPEHEKNTDDIDKKNQLSTYNDLIHEIEDLTLRPTESRPHLLICPDYLPDIPLEKDDFKLFRASHQFGSLVLHYCHVGRHPFELYSASDLNCPVDQIVPQRNIATYHTLRFYNSSYMEHWHKGRFKNFYEHSTLKQVIDWNDPMMAFGYIPMGKLVTSLSLQDVLDQVKSCNRIVNWRVY